MRLGYEVNYPEYAFDQKMIETKKMRLAVKYSDFPFE